MYMKIHGEITVRWGARCVAYVPGGEARALRLGRESEEIKRDSAQQMKPSHRIKKTY